MDFRIEAACGSSVGKVRHNNEDNFLFDGICLPQDNCGQLPPLNLYGTFEGNVSMAVFDGMGGMDYGEVASATAASYLKERLSEDVALQDLCLQANQAVWEAQTALGTHNMGTTLAMLCFCQNRVQAVNIGDSRIFGLRDDRLMQISFDHTDEAYLRKKGILGRKPKLTQYLGMDPMQVRVEPYITGGIVQEGDIYLICSDGLTDLLDEETIARYLSVSGTAAACVENLISAALEKGGHDNITVIVCRVLEQTTSGRNEHDANGSQSPLERLASHRVSWGRKLWSGIQDRANHIRNN